MSFSEINQLMSEEFEKADKIYHPSLYWQHLNREHGEKLSREGVENFKRTIAKNYFTWMRIRPSDPQIAFLRESVGLPRLIKSFFKAFIPIKHRYIPFLEGMAANFLTHLLWDYVLQLKPEFVEQLSEPSFGNPLRIRSGGQLISQDIANSVLEYDSMNSRGHLERARTICELGGGYGRTTYVIRSLQKHLRCIIVDIPPALAIAQHYLSTVCNDANVFKFRPFNRFDDVRVEIERSDLIFMLPHQLAMIPNGYIDFFINISSFHEMAVEQIRHYVETISRVVRPGGSFYLKAWKVSKIPFDNIELKYEDYGLDDWNSIFHRTARVQTPFFEALLEKK